MTDNNRVTIELEACEPTELASPTEAVRWYIVADERGPFPVVRIEGDVWLVEQFVRLHWGDDMIDGVYFSADGFFADYAATGLPIGGES